MISAYLSTLRRFCQPYFQIENCCTMYQQIAILGNLGSTPEMRYTPNGIPVTNFSVAVNEKYGETESTTWLCAI
jgi:hypothetical protein